MQILDKPALSHANQAEALNDGNRGDSRVSGGIPNGLQPLALALSYARDVAAILRELHRTGRCHGAVAECLMLEPHRATLIPPRDFPEIVDQGLDVRAFGSLLYEMVTKLRPSEEVGGIESSPPAAVQGSEGVRLAAVQLALRCLETSDGLRPNMQRVLTELRLYRIVARQLEVPASTSRCPRCGGPLVYSSLPKTWFERMLGRMGIHLHRCHRCYYRF